MASPAGTHCSCRPPLPARRASRLAIRVHLCARAERRNACMAGANATLGDNCHADATEGSTRRYAETPAVWYATRREHTDADASTRVRRRRNWDATEDGQDATEDGWLIGDSTRRDQRDSVQDNSATLGVFAVGKRRNEDFRVRGPARTVDNCVSSRPVSKTGSRPWTDTLTPLVFSLRSHELIVVVGQHQGAKWALTRKSA
jgi:hypothetical protein